MVITISFSRFPSALLAVAVSIIVILFLAKVLFFRQKKIVEILEDRICVFLWPFLPKRIEEYGDVKVKYAVVPGFLLIKSVLAFVKYSAKYDRVMIFIKPYEYEKRFTIYHEYIEGGILRSHSSSKRVAEMAFRMLQLPSEDVERILILRRESESLTDKIIAAIGDPEKVRKLVESAPPESLLLAKIRLFAFINCEKYAHAFARLAELELAKKELSPEGFAVMLHEQFNIET